MTVNATYAAKYTPFYAFGNGFGPNHVVTGCFGYIAATTPGFIDLVSGVATAKTPPTLANTLIPITGGGRYPFWYDHTTGDWTLCLIAQVPATPGSQNIGVLSSWGQNYTINPVGTGWTLVGFHGFVDRNTAIVSATPTGGHPILTTYNITTQTFGGTTIYDAGATATAYYIDYSGNIYWFDGANAVHDGIISGNQTQSANRSVIAAKAYDPTTYYVVLNNKFGWRQAANAAAAFSGDFTTSKFAVGGDAAGGLLWHDGGSDGVTIQEHYGDAPASVYFNFCIPSIADNTATFRTIRTASVPAYEWDFYTTGFVPPPPRVIPPRFVLKSDLNNFAHEITGYYPPQQKKP